MKIDPKTPYIYIYIWRLHRTFSKHKKERRFLQGLPGFLGQKKRTFGAKNQLFDDFFDGFDLKTSDDSDLDPQNHVLSQN